ncbi:MAG: PhoH family protein, partial [Treponemataceae bacterium]|nr:PhoH family protein [Treponemataceae bacterium]
VVRHQLVQKIINAYAKFDKDKTYGEGNHGKRP